MKLAIQGFIASSLLTACALPIYPDYKWTHVRPAKEKIEWRVVSQAEINSVCADIAKYNPTACTDSRNGKCVVYAQRPIIEESAEVVRHEIAHCMGYSHKGQI